MLSLLKSNKPVVKLFLCLNAITGLYWILANTTNVYYFIVTGAIFEMTSIIMAAILFALPLANLVALIVVKDHRKIMGVFLLWSILILSAMFLLFGK